MIKRCRNCNELYDTTRSRSWYTGYCTMRCMRAKARKLGCRGRSDEYHYLKRAGEIGYKDP